MLIGQYISKLTDKDRISVPKKVRAELGEELVIARWYEKCLVLVAKDSWEKLQSRVRGKTSIITTPVRDIERFILGLAFEIRLDKQGRFVLPKPLIDYAQVKDEIIFVGLGDRCEVWASESWINLENQVEEKARKAIDRISKIKP